MRNSNFSRTGGAAQARPININTSGIQAEHFLRDANRFLSVLEKIMKQQSFSSGELRDYTLNVHSAKTLLLGVGDNEYAGIAGDLEKAGRDAKLDIIKSKTPPLLSRLKGVVKVLEQEVAKGRNTDYSRPEDKTFLREQLSIIKDACNSYNKRGAENAIEALKQKPCSRETENLLSDISLHLLRGNFEEAANLAAT